MTNAVLDAIENRRTTNKYDRLRNISDAQILDLVPLITRAPTALRPRNWRFIAVKTPEAKARVKVLIEKGLGQPGDVERHLGEYTASFVE